VYVLCVFGVGVWALVRGVIISKLLLFGVHALVLALQRASQHHIRPGEKQRQMAGWGEVGTGVEIRDD